ncbi:hypothetical protein FSST1_000855 [Fusarium sambucinum]
MVLILGRQSCFCCARHSFRRSNSHARRSPICCSPSETESYLKVRRALRRIATKSSNAGPTLKRISTYSSNIVLSNLERTCMSLLSDNDVAKDVEPPPKPVPGTCQWIRSHGLFLSWLEEGTSALLWLTGHPGCGKTMISYSLAQYFDNACNKSRNVLIYLCQNKNKQTDARAVLIGLILQIVDRQRSLVRYVRSAFEKEGSSIIQSFASLWRIFLRISKDPKSGPLYTIMDILDEREREGIMPSVARLDIRYARRLFSVNEEW